jgi:hypothetical protein
LACHGGFLDNGWVGGWGEPAGCGERGKEKKLQQQRVSRDQSEAAAEQPSSPTKTRRALRLPGEQDNFQQIRCQKNWILQPLTLFLGPL